MPEYIAYCGQGSQADELMRMSGRAELIRCRDCNNLHEYTKIDRQQSEQNERTEYKCILLHRKVELDRFCAWGDRR